MGSRGEMSSATILKNAYQIGIITALPIERAAITAMLDVQHEKPSDFIQASHDANCYTWGRIGLHNVVIASLSAGVYGNTMATTTAMDMLWSFQNIKFGLMVGIGAGIPLRDIRLGDVVVSQPSGLSGGVFQYDIGKARHNEWERRDFLARPPDILLKALNKLQTEHEFQSPRAHEYLHAAIKKHAYWGTLYGRPSIDDQLFHSSYLHNVESSRGTCSACDNSKIVTRPQRSPNDDFKIHYGIIASGNSLVKDAKLRDWIASMEQDCACIEMEAAGLMNNFPCLVIRGICDYADSHKNDVWQRYACAAAAAFSKELLSFVPITDSGAVPAPMVILQTPASEQITGTLSLKDEPQQAGHETSPQRLPLNDNASVSKPISVNSVQQSTSSIAAGSETAASADNTTISDATETHALDQSVLPERVLGGSRHFLRAVAKGDTAYISLLLEQGANVETRDSPKGDTPLIIAARKGHLDVVKLLIEHGADIEARDGDRRDTPLVFAAEEGHLDIVKLLIKHKANTNPRSAYGVTPLYNAAIKGYLDVAKLLIEHNANVDTARWDGWNPLTVAAYSNHPDMVRLLLEHGAMTTAMSPYGTALDIARKRNFDEVAKLLEAHKHKETRREQPLDLF